MPSLPMLLAKQSSTAVAVLGHDRYALEKHNKVCSTCRLMMNISQRCASGRSCRTAKPDCSVCGGTRQEQVAAAPQPIYPHYHVTVRKA